MNNQPLEQARLLLAAQGLEANVDVAGFQQEILSVRATIHQFEQLRGLAGQLKELGFKYITLELDSEGQQ